MSIGKDMMTIPVTAASMHSGTTRITANGSRQLSYFAANMK